MSVFLNEVLRILSYFKINKNVTVNKQTEILKKNYVLKRISLDISRKEWIVFLYLIKYCFVIILDKHYILLSNIRDYN